MHATKHNFWDFFSLGVYWLGGYKSTTHFFLNGKPKIYFFSSNETNANVDRWQTGHGLNPSKWAVTINVISTSLWYWNEAYPTDKIDKMFCELENPNIPYP